MSHRSRRELWNMFGRSLTRISKRKDRTLPNEWQFIFPKQRRGNPQKGDDVFYYHPRSGDWSIGYIREYISPNDFRFAFYMCRRAARMLATEADVITIPDN